MLHDSVLSLCNRLKSKPFMMITLLSFFAVSASAHETNGDVWMGIYLGDTKIGYTSFNVTKSSFQGKSGYRVQTSSVLRVLALGETVEASQKTTSYLGPKFEPLFESFTMSSAGHTSTITVKFTEDEVVAEVDSGDTKSTERIPIPPGAVLIGDENLFASMLKPGEKATVKAFSMPAVGLDDVTIEAIGREGITVGGEEMDALVVKSRNSLGETTYWQDEKGIPLKTQWLMGTVMIREPKEVAMDLPEMQEDCPPSDIAVLTSVPSSAVLREPQKIRSMTVRITGLDKSLAINDRRQRVVFSSEDASVAEYRITSSDFSSSRAPSLPIDDARFRDYLGDSPYIQPTNEAVRAAAADIIGDEKNAWRAASLIRDWVHSNMRVKGNIGVLRSSADLLQTKTGVCRDFAIIYTALARASGIPTRLAVGLAFWKDGFYNHAWAESYVGQWVPLDATLPSDFVDATHIKLAHGDSSVMFNVAKTAGNLKAEIVEYK